VKGHKIGSSHILLSKKFCVSALISFVQAKWRKRYGICSKHWAFYIVRWVTVVQQQTVQHQKYQTMSFYKTQNSFLRLLRFQPHRTLRWSASFGSFQAEARGIHTEKSNKMQQCIKIYYSIFIWSSTCFGRHTAHHQEPKPALAASGIAYVEGCWTCGCWTLVRLCLTHKSEAASAVLGSLWWAVCRPKHSELHINME